MTQLTKVKTVSRASLLRLPTAAQGPSAGSGAPAGGSSVGKSAIGVVGCVAPPAVLPRWSVWILRVAPGTMRPNNIGPQPYHMALFELARSTAAPSRPTGGEVCWHSWHLT